MPFQYFYQYWDNQPKILQEFPDFSILQLIYMLLYSRRCFTPFAAIMTKLFLWLGTAVVMKLG